MEEISLKMKTLRKSLKTKRKSLKNLLKEFSKTKTNLKSTLQTRYEEIVSKSGSGTFFFFGDSGTPNLPMQNLMKQMKKDYADTEAPQGIVLLGDNFYPKGVSSVRDSQWEHTYKSLLPEEHFNTKVYALLGNHDYYGNTQAQIDYTQKDSRWEMPAKWYKTEHCFEAEDGSVCRILMIYLDSFSLDDNETQDMLSFAPYAGYKSQTEVNKIFQVLAEEKPLQLEWLTNTLKEATKNDTDDKRHYDYKVICAHYPVYSIGMHGTSKVLIDLLVPIMEKYGIDFYINGHDHSLQITKQKEVVYATAGSGCNKFYYSNESKPNYFFSRLPGYAKLEMTKKEAVLSMVDLNGKVLKTEVVQNKSNKLATAGEEKEAKEQRESQSTIEETVDEETKPVDEKDASSKPTATDEAIGESIAG